MDNKDLSTYYDYIIDKIYKFTQKIVGYMNDIVISASMKKINKFMDKNNKDRLINMVNIIQKHFEHKDGCGLTSGSIIDSIFCEYLHKISNGEIKECHKDESDILIEKFPFSFKKIDKKASIALDWSKNINFSKKSYFNYNIIILVLKNHQWWKRQPRDKHRYDIDYTQVIKSGLYIVDRLYCINNVKFSSNNKTNTLIDPQYVYEILLHAIKNKRYIEFDDKYTRYYKSYSFISGFE
jgi:hypothetical protein